MKKLSKKLAMELTMEFSFFFDLFFSLKNLKFADKIKFIAMLQPSNELEKCFLKLLITIYKTNLKHHSPNNKYFDEFAFKFTLKNYIIAQLLNDNFFILDDEFYEYLEGEFYELLDSFDLYSCFLIHQIFQFSKKKKKW